MQSQPDLSQHYEKLHVATANDILSYTTKADEQLIGLLSIVMGIRL